MTGAHDRRRLGDTRVSKRDGDTGHFGAGHDGAAVPSTLKGAHAHDKEVCEAIQTFVPAQT